MFVFLTALRANIVTIFFNPKQRFANQTDELIASHILTPLIFISLCPCDDGHTYQGGKFGAKGKSKIVLGLL